MIRRAQRLARILCRARHGRRHAGGASICRRFDRCRLSQSQHRSPTRTFTSPIIFHYTYVLFLSLAALVPINTDHSLAALIGVSAAVALLFDCHTGPRHAHEDRRPIFQMIASLTAQALWWPTPPRSSRQFSFSCIPKLALRLAGALVLLLIVNIRNAWDLTVFFAQRRTDNPLPPPASTPSLVRRRHLDLRPRL